MALQAPALDPEPTLAVDQALHGHRFRTSKLAAVFAVLLTVSFLALAFARQRGRLLHTDLRVIAHIVPGRYHPRLLAAVEPLLHLGDAAVLIALIAVAGGVLWLLGYRRTWVLWIGLLTWPIELSCKAIFDQPGALDPSGGAAWVSETLQLKDLVHGASTRSLVDWLGHAVPGFQVLAHSAGSVTVGLDSSFPSGTAARGAFVLGLLALTCLRLPLPVLRELAAFCLVALVVPLGFALILFAWHLPSDVLGGSMLGAALLAGVEALLLRPVR